jgi:branched-chain amino acid transport system ATP-binding protein
MESNGRSGGLDSPAAEQILAVNNVEVIYNQVILVLRGLSLAVRKGEIVALLGSNGAGKSTTLKAISGLLPSEDGEVTQGEILYDGERIDGRDAADIVRRGISQVMEGRRIFEHLTAEENLRAGAYARRGNGSFQEDLELVYGYFPPLYERRRQAAGYLSGGEQQMLAIGRALMARPRLLMLDEPSLGLAPTIVRELFATVRRLNEEDGLTVLVVEQNATIALDIASRAYVLEVGKVAVEGTSDELQRHEGVRKSYLGY